MTSPVPWRLRLALSVALGLLAGFLSLHQSGIDPFPRDFGQAWFAAKSVLHGADPYPLVGPGRSFEWRWPLVYPMTAALVATPFAVFTEPVGSALFAMLGGGLFAWALMRFGYGPLFGFFSLSMRGAAGAAQWSPLFSAAFVLVPLGLILAAKPTLGAAIFVARPSWWAVGGGVLLLTLSFAVQPHWLREWLDAVSEYQAIGGPDDRPYRTIASFPGGALALLSLLRWRRPEARLVAMLACVPITIATYETVPLFLVPQAFWQSALLVGLSYAQHYLTWWLAPVPLTHGSSQEVAGRLMAVLMYLPATLMVLRRPNEGPVPAWLERAIRYFPPALRGNAGSAPSPTPATTDRASSYI